MRVRSFLDALLRRSHLESRLDAEMRFHIETYVGDLVERGVSRKEAARRARIEFGGMEARKDECRESRGLRWPQEIAQNLRFAARTAKKNRGFALVATATLALGIGANTTIFSVVQAVILRPLPFPAPDRLVMIRERDLQGGSFSVTWPDFEDWRNQGRSFEGMSAFTQSHLELTGVARPLLLRGASVSAQFFKLLGAKAEIGHTFTSQEDQPGGAPVVVISDTLWHSAFGGDVAILGRPVVLNGAAYTVIGVLEPLFAYLTKDTDVYLPLGTRAADPSFNNRGAHGNMHVLGRIAEGITIDTARADLDTIMARSEKQYPDTNKGHRVLITSLSDVVAGSVRPVLYILFAAVGVVLLIACVNVANLLLARAADRRREFAIRASLGASRARLIRQAITESLLLALCGGGTGFAIATWALGPLVRFAPRQIPRLDAVHADASVLSFTIAITLITGLFFGLAPALQTSRSDVNEALKDGGRTIRGDRSRQRLRTGLLVAEVSFASVLLIVSTLLIRSLLAALAANPGFRPDHLVALDVLLMSPKYQKAAAVQTFLAAATEKIQRTPNIESVGAARCPPLAMDCGDYWYEIPGRTHFTPGTADDSLFNVADAGYFPTIGTRILEGRNFGASDVAGARPVAIINETLARKWWPKDSPVGWRIKYGGPGEKGRLYEIVGVVHDVNREGLDTPPEPEVFLAAGQEMDQGVVLLVRSSLDPERAAAAVEAAMQAVDKDLPVRVAPLTKIMAESLAKRRFLTTLLAAFGALALVLAGVGVYGVIAYQVAQRTHEIGIRKALGARPRDVAGLFIRRGLALVLGGLLIGVAEALALSRLIETLLFGVKPWDALTLTLAPLVLGAVAALASYLPARRAMRVDPVIALRQE